MLTNIMLYWVTGAIGSSFWPYYARMHGPWPIPDGARIGVPMGYAEFPKEILRPPRSLAEKMYSDIRRWSKMPKGGHFAALEQPELLARRSASSSGRCARRAALIPVYADAPIHSVCEMAQPSRQLNKIGSTNDPRILSCGRRAGIGCSAGMSMAAAEHPG